MSSLKLLRVPVAVLLVMVCPAEVCDSTKPAELNRMAGQLFAQGKYSEAAARLKCSLAADPKQPRALKLLGLSTQLAGDLQGALDVFLSLRKMDPNDHEGLFFLGRVYYEQNFFGQAREALEAANQKKSDDPRTRVYLAMTLEAIGETNMALDHYAEARRLERNPARLWTVRMSYGALLHKVGRLAESETELKAARDLNPEHWQPRFELAKLYHATGRSGDAAGELNVAMKSGATGEDAERIRSLLATVRSAKQASPGSIRSVPAPSATVPITFIDVAKEAGIDFILRNHATPQKHQIETMPGGIAVIDYDNDGFEDLYFTNGAAVPQLAKTGPADWNRLYRNNGNGTFTDVTERSGVAGEGYSMGAAAGDFDNDGWQDLFVAGVNRNILYRNNGDGSFSDVTAKSGIKGAGEGKPWSISAGWFDFDNDGDLDLFVVNYCKWSAINEPFCGDAKNRAYCHPRFYEGLPNTLYRNNGDSTFTDVSESAGIKSHVGKGMAVAFADLDNDGKLDAVTTNDTEPNFLFRNRGDGTFAEVGLPAGIAYNLDGRASSSMGLDIRDYDNDGLPDILITALSNETFSLFKNAGGMKFTDATYSSGMAVLTLPWSGWGVGLVDFNNDGFKDVFTANSHVLDNVESSSARTYRQPNMVLASTGNGRFADARSGSASAVWAARAHRGSALLDFDNDGRMDVVVSSLNDRVELLRNVSDGRQHWIALELKGTKSNRDAIGAQVRLVLPSGRVLHDYVSTAVGYASSSTRRIHIGLGSEQSIKRLEIRWPRGGTQVIENVKTNQLLRVVEP